MKLVNKTDRDIRMIKGAVRFFDPFGDHIGSLALTPDVSITAGGELTEGGSYRVDRLAKIRPEDTTTLVCIAGVVFGDGTVQKDF